MRSKWQMHRTLGQGRPHRNPNRAGENHEEINDATAMPGGTRVALGQANEEETGIPNEASRHEEREPPQPASVPAQTEPAQ